MAVYDRAATERALIDAVDALITKKGFSALGVNAIAREAKVNKALIYRYFDDLDGLYIAFAEAYDLWPPLEELLGSVLDDLRGADWREILAELMVLYARALRHRPRTLELLAWECVERNALTIAFETLRERRSQETFAAVAASGIAPGVDLRLPVALLASAVHYLAIRSRDIRIFAGADIRSDHFWEHELRLTLEAMIAGL